MVLHPEIMHQLQKLTSHNCPLKPLLSNHLRAGTQLLYSIFPCDYALKLQLIPNYTSKRKKQSLLWHQFNLTTLIPNKFNDAIPNCQQHSRDNSCTNA